jgi:hypothetical protein
MRIVRRLALVALGLAAPSFAAAQPPAPRLVLDFMIQQIPDRSGVRQKFPMLVYQALVQPG